MAKLDFTSRKRARNYLARHEQRRLLWIVLALGLVLLAIGKARDPGSFAWIAQLGENRPSDRDKSIDRRAIDTRVEGPESPRALAGPIVSSPGVPERRDHGVEGPGTIRPEDLAAIQDDTPFRRAERDAWFGLLGFLKSATPTQLQRGSLGPVTFVQLFQQPQEYRGRIVSIRGTVRRAHRVSAPANKAGIAEYYQLWVQPSEHPSDPIVVYALELPKGFPTGMGVTEEVTITGIFFKRWSYKAQDSLRTAPVLLSRSVDWTPSERLAGRQRTRSVPSPWLALGLGAAIAGVVIGYLYLRTRPARRAPVEPDRFGNVPEA